VPHRRGVRAGADGQPLRGPCGRHVSRILADFANNQALYVGPVAPSALDGPLDRIAITIDTPAGRLMTLDGRHPDGHPLMPLMARQFPADADGTCAPARS
jgi:hypothetical protein